MPAPAARQRHDLQAPLADQRSLMQPWNFFCGWTWTSNRKRNSFLKAPLICFGSFFRTCCEKRGPLQMHDTIHGIHQTHRLCFLCDPQRTEVISGLGVVVGTLNSDSVNADFGLLTQQGCCRP